MLYIADFKVKKTHAHSRLVAGSVHST